MTKSLRDFRLQANPEYELVLLDRLPEAEQQTLQGLKGDPECYGILRPRNSGNLTIKAASRDAALLFFTLQNPGPLPRYVETSLGQECDRTIAQMVLDGILEIEADGVMLSGPAAHAHICDDQPFVEQESFLAALSRRALQYAETLAVTEASLLSHRLYSYNRLPASPRWRQLLPDKDAVERHLGVDEGAAGRLLSRNWTRIPSSPQQPWLAWQSHRAPAITEPGPTYKLYVSPACSELPEAFQAIAAVAATSPFHHFKVGSDVYGLLRPDKMVLYFHHLADLQETGERIMQELSECPAHGVPFTAELAGNGLLSWGIDPPAEKHTVPWLERESWRLWIANRLAAALIVARNSGNTDIPPWRFALERLRLEGVETQTWTPSRTLAWAESIPGESYGTN
ncbi:MAG TPA: hypothetical protein VI685_22265 [Candidatus Angelobacter sp.]